MRFDGPGTRTLSLRKTNFRTFSLPLLLIWLVLAEFHWIDSQTLAQPSAGSPQLNADPHPALGDQPGFAEIQCHFIELYRQHGARVALTEMDKLSSNAPAARTLLPVRALIMMLSGHTTGLNELIREFNGLSATCILLPLLNLQDAEIQTVDNCLLNSKFPPQEYWGLGAWYLCGKLHCPQDDLMSRIHALFLHNSPLVTDSCGATLCLYLARKSKSREVELAKRWTLRDPTNGSAAAILLMSAPNAKKLFIASASKHKFRHNTILFPLCNYLLCSPTERDFQHSQLLRAVQNHNLSSDECFWPMYIDLIYYNLGPQAALRASLILMACAQSSQLLDQSRKYLYLVPGTISNRLQLVQSILSEVRSAPQGLKDSLLALCKLDLLPVDDLPKPTDSNRSELSLKYKERYAEYLMTNKRVTEAIGYLNQLIVVEPSNSYVRCLLASCLFDQMDYDKSLKIIDETLSLRNQSSTQTNYLANRSKLLHLRAENLVRLMRWKDSIEAYNEVIRAEPYDVSLYQSRAFVYLYGLNDRKAAKADMDHCLLCPKFFQRRRTYWRDTTEKMRHYDCTKILGRVNTK